MGLLLVICLCVALAVIAFAIALRGRRVGEAMHCRGCGFNLTGLPDETNRCPECGGAIVLPGGKGIRRGERRRRPIVAGIGVLLVLLAGGLSWRVATSPQPIRPMLPTGWLLVQLRFDPACVDELDEREDDGLIDARDRGRVTNFVLSQHGNGRQPWPKQYEKWMTRRGNQNELSSAQVERFARQSMFPIQVATVLPKIRRGEPIFFTVSVPVGPKHRAGWVHVEFQDPAFQEGDIRNLIFNDVSQRATGRLRLDNATSHLLPVGRHEIGLSVEREWGSWNQQRITLREDHTLSFEIVPEDQPVVRMIDNPTLREQMRACVHLALKVPGGEEPAYEVRVVNPPVNLSMDVNWWRADQKWPPLLPGKRFPSLVVKAGETGSSVISYDDLEVDGIEYSRQPPTHLYLRPAWSGAEEMPFEEMWNEEIVFDVAKLERVPAK